MAEHTADRVVAGAALNRLLEIMRQLRAPDGCPWDRAQDLASLRPYLLEETYEVLDALDGQDLPELRLELGDLLFQIVFQSQLAEELGAFTMADVVNGIADKLTRRHPHVFGEARSQSLAEIEQGWAELKRQERLAGGDTRPSALAGIPHQAPALLRAERMGEKAAREGFDWPTLAGVRAKVSEELLELDVAIAGGDSRRAQEELGDLLFSLCNLARWLKTPAEDALRGALGRFETRFRFIEETLAARGARLRDIEPAEAERLWAEAKRASATK